MSWSFHIKGTREEVKEKVTAECDAIAGRYVGKPEADDVIMVRERVLALTDAMALDAENDGVLARGVGSHWTTEAGLANGQASFQVNRVPLDKPTPTA